MKIYYYAFVFILLNSCAGENTGLDTSDWKIYEGENYTVKYPEDWKMDTGGFMNTVFFVSSPVEEGDNFSENVNLNIQDLSRFPMDLDEYTDVSIEQIKTLIPDGKLKKEERLKGSKYDYHSVLYSADFYSEPLMTAQYYWVIDTKAYVLTFTALTAEYDQYEKIGYGIMNSFSID